MKLCALVVWFNPKKLGNSVERIKSYSTFCEKVFIVDNSSDDNSTLASKIKNAIYIPLKENTGIAHALNVGCRKAIDEGFDWCLTMDQDSVWKESEIKNYIEIADKNKNEYQNFAPSIRQRTYPSLLGNLKRKLLHRKSLPQFNDGIQFSDRWITSGSLMNLNAYKKVTIQNGGGYGFNEKFFIDEVDYDYCERFVTSGFKCRFCPETHLNHSLGNPETKHRTLFPQWNVHSDFRLYYIIRNSTFMCREYPDYTKKYGYKKMQRMKILSRLLRSKTPKDFFAALKLVEDAKRDAKKL